MRPKTINVTRASSPCEPLCTGWKPVSLGILFAPLLMLFLPFTLLAQDTSALINEQLDKPVAKLELNGTLPQVMNTIGEQTGVRLEASPAVWDLLPWGQG